MRDNRLRGTVALVESLVIMCEPVKKIYGKNRNLVPDYRAIKASSDCFQYFEIFSLSILIQ